MLMDMKNDMNDRDAKPKKLLCKKCKEPLTKKNIYEV